MKCTQCDSTEHFRRFCPKTPRNTFLQSCFDTGDDGLLGTVSNDFEYASTFLLSNDTMNRALIDTGAVSNVCGDTFYKEFVRSLPTWKKNLIRETDSWMTFRFGDGKTIRSTKHVLLPVFLCGKERTLDTFIVPGDLPLLFSRKSMKALGVSLDIVNDTISIDGITQELESTGSGHIVVDILGNNDAGNKGALTLIATEGNKALEPKAIVKKLHRYFGHPNPKTLLKLVRDTEHWSKELGDEIKNLECDHCVRYRKDTSKPKVSIWSPTDVNEVIAMDLKFLNDEETIIMLHMIDLFSRFSLTAIVPDKKAETIMAAFFQTWIIVMGRPKLVLFDNGGEFYNDTMTEMCENMGIQLRTTGADSPWSNGMCERHNGLIADTFNKLRDELPWTDARILLAWATNGKNSLSNTYGHSPYTLVFGRTPSIPSLDSVEMITTMNESTANKVLADHLNVMYLSRSAFLKANNSDKVKRALKSRIPNSEEEYFSGDRVYFRRRNMRRWCGPATVIGKDGKIVFLRQGGSIMRVHATKCVLRERADSAVLRDSQDQQNSDPSYIPTVSQESANRFGRTRDHSRKPTPEEQSGEDKRKRRSDQNSSDNDTDSEDELQVIREEETNSTPRPTSNWGEVALKRNKVMNLSANDIIRFKPKNTTSEWKTASVHSYAGKVKATKSVDQNRFNLIEDGNHINLRLNEYDVEKEAIIDNQEDDQMDVDADINEVDINEDNISEEQPSREEDNEEEVSMVMYIEDPIVSETFVVSVPKERHHEPGVVKAMEAELDTWKKYEVYHEVPDIGQPTVSTRWVVTDKSGGNFKARMVVRGFEERNDTAAGSPTCEKSSTRIVYTLAAANSWKIETVDIKAAFLQAQTLDRAVYVKPPRKLKKVGIIWQLDKPAYGLADSSRNWYVSLSTFLISVGCKRNDLDTALFYHREDSKLNGMICLHVDDFLICGNTKFNQLVTKPLLAKYDISKHKIGHFIYTGVNVIQNNDSIVVEQFDYAEKVKIVHLDRARRMQKDSDLTTEEKTGYLSLLGKLSWLSNVTRPDLKWDVYFYSRKNGTPTISDMIGLNGIVSKLNEKKHIRFPKLQLKDGLKIIVHSDASFSNLDQKVNSGRGYIIFLCSEDQAAVLAWASNKVKRVVSSTLESEALALIDGLNHAHALRDILSNLLYGGIIDSALSIVAFVDSKQLHDAIYSSRSVSDHRLRRDIANVKERLEIGEVSQVRWIATTEMLADPLTKCGADPRKLDYVLDTGLMNRI